ncbi:DUF4180 domain-containing protein [Lysobacter korlensis]|uniref:DUF4180 domain-containing protein n=1 Tax=Lysobacter korlensis TaxID=553636 RepID=A0ABV6RZ66_9GAMM
MRIDDHGDIRVLHLDPDGPLVSTSDDASDLIGNAWSEGISTIAIPVSRLDPGFFDLSTRKAGEITQKLVNYRLRLVVVGDVSVFEAASGAFRDYVWESNRSQHVWFVTDEAALAERLAR